MKQKNILLLCLAVVMMAACDSNLTEEIGGTPQLGPDGEMPVSFNAYTSRGTTRAGVTSTIENTALKDAATDLGKVGFGVFAYYTNAEYYAADCRPNFMFNKQVKWNDSYNIFDYSPVRYWPNEYGSKAQSEDVDKVSFFAYAPYVKVNPSTGYLADAGEGNEAATWGITGTTRNTYTGDPLVKYIASFDMDKSVDLCWGVYNEGTSGWATMNGKQTTTDGLPWLNVQHAQSVDQHLNFTFRHATARLNVQVDANVDDGGNTTALGTHYGTSATDNVTKVYVRSISFTGMAAQGALNLNNVKPNEPLWMNYMGTGWIENGQTLTIHDGLRDGHEGATQAVANNETMTGLNPVVISNEGNTSAGVTHTAVNLFGRSSGTSGLTDGVYVIPTGEKVRMTIVYDVETAVADLPRYLSDGVTHGSSIENRITTDLKTGGSDLVFEGGKSYTLKLHLGMNSVKFDATVSGDWADNCTVSVPNQFTVSTTVPQPILIEADGITPQGPDLSYIKVYDPDRSKNLTEGIDYEISYSGTLSDGTPYGPSTEKPIKEGRYTMVFTGKTGTDYEGVVRNLPFSIEEETAGDGFTINANGDKVMFAPGNLQATTTDLGASWTWAFAEHQYDYIGSNGANININGNGTVSGNGTIDLFSWVGASSSLTGAAQFGISNSTALGSVAGEKLKAEWNSANLSITNAGGYTWRMLTEDEWEYILTSNRGTRVAGKENVSFTMATIQVGNESVKGLILFPDNCKIFKSRASDWGFYEWMTYNDHDSYGSYPTKVVSWSYFQNLGCVFLPAAGRRNYSYYSYPYESGYFNYWINSSPFNEYRYSTCLTYETNTNWLGLSARDRSNGNSVRLVRDVE